MHSKDELPGRPSRGVRQRISSFVDNHFLVLASSPALLVMLAVTLAPFAATIGLSLTNYDLLRSTSVNFVGVGNFARLAADPDLWTYVGNTLYFVLGATILEVVFGLGLALLMEHSFRGVGLLRTLFLIPVMTAPLVVAVSWRAMFNPSAGWINYFLGLVGLPQPNWLGDPTLAMPVVIFVDMWSSVPFFAVLLLAGLLGVPSELKEAAEVDGAGRVRVFRHITLPLIRPVLFVALALKGMDAFRRFESIQQVTNGGPGTSTTTINLHIYQVALYGFDLGYGATWGVLMLALIAVFLGVLYLLLGRGSGFGEAR